MRVTKPDKIKQYYEALVTKDKDFVGIFFAGVKTTSVFCIATCYARKPKFENVEFFTTVADALAHGYRPCKLCRPTENAAEAPPAVAAAIALVRDNPKIKISDARLQTEGINPSVVRQWFKKTYDMTFHAYQRMYRINNAFMELKQGGSVLDTAMASGFESLSGFGYTFKKIIGTSPMQTTMTNILYLNRFTTPVGPMFVCASDRGVCLLEFTNRRMLETEFEDLQKRLKATIVVGDNEHTKQAQKEIADYFAGTRTHFTVALDTPGTPFQQLVWQGLQDIPYGTTTSYQAQAQHIEKPRAVRAVASANGHNRVAIIIPCHRVIGKDGSLTGYGGGIERKQWLLDHEQAHRTE